MHVLQDDFNPRKNHLSLSPHILLYTPNRANKLNSNSWSSTLKHFNAIHPVSQISDANVLLKMDILVHWDGHMRIIFLASCVFKKPRNLFAQWLRVMCYHSFLFQWTVYVLSAFASRPNRNRRTWFCNRCGQTERTIMFLCSFGMHGWENSA